MLLHLHAAEKGNRLTSEYIISIYIYLISCKQFKYRIHLYIVFIVQGIFRGNLEPEMAILQPFKSFENDMNDTSSPFQIISFFTLSLH